MSEKLINLAKKLRELALRGIGGEKTNAEQLLSRIMSENNISIESLESIKRESETFYCKVDHRFLLVQIAFMVLGSGAAIYKLRRKPSCMRAECTPAEKLEIEAVFDFYKRAYEQDLKLLQSAFIQKNKIFPKDGQALDIDSLSEEEKTKAFKVGLLAEGLSRHHMRKQLGMDKNTNKRSAL